MAITKLTGFKGDAEILGSLREVEYDGAILSGSALKIFGLRTEDAEAILNALSTRAVTAVRPLAQNVGTAVTPEEMRARAPKNGAGVQPAAGLKVESKATPEPEKATEKELEFPPKEEKGAEPAPAAAEGGVPEKIAKSGRFIEVMDWVMKERGLKPSQVDEIVAECEKLAPQIKVVERVRNLKEKVESNLAAYAEAGAASA